MEAAARLSLQLNFDTHLLDYLCVSLHGRTEQVPAPLRHAPMKARARSKRPHSPHERAAWPHVHAAAARRRLPACSLTP
jgi:hypothetical protein